MKFEEYIQNEIDKTGNWFDRHANLSALSAGMIILDMSGETRTYLVAFSVGGNIPSLLFDKTAEGGVSGPYFSASTLLSFV